MKHYKLRSFSPLFFVVILCAAASFAHAQMTAFKYQGRLTDGGSLASGAFQMQFKMFDAVSGGTQIGPTLPDVPVTAVNGVFTVSLDFGSNALSGANRWIEIAVRRNAGESYVTLSPREQISSSPYAVRTLSAQQADTALDSEKLGGVDANQFVQTADARLTNARDPNPGSANYIQNQNIGPQAATSFNISGSGTAAAFNVNGPLNFGGAAAPAVAPAGQSRFFFDAATNKLKISESGGAYVNLIGSGPVSGTGTPNRISYWSTGNTLGEANIFQAGTNIGIGTATPGSGFELRGTNIGAQQRITDSVSGNSLVLQGGPGNNMKVTGFHYGTNTPQPLYLSTDGANTLINTGGGLLGVGTASPSPFYRIDSAGSVRAFSNTHTNFTVETSGTNNSARLNMKTPFRNWFIGTSQALNDNQFYIGEGDGTSGGQRMVITTGGTFGFGTVNPHLGYRADFIGGVRSTDSGSTHFVAETTGGTNSWARYYMRSVNPDGSLHQSWLMGTSRDFNGNQLYIWDETFNQTRMSIQPNGGPIYMQGMVTSSVGGYGLPKAMLFVRANGTIGHCFNGITGQASSGCGFTVTRTVVSGPIYTIDIGSPTSFRFVNVVGEGTANFASRVSGRSGNSITVRFFDENDFFTQDSDFHLIVY